MSSGFSRSGLLVSRVSVDSEPVIVDGLRLQKAESADEIEECPGETTLVFVLKSFVVGLLRGFDGETVSAMSFTTLPPFSLLEAVPFSIVPSSRRGLRSKESSEYSAESSE